MPMIIDNGLLTLIKPEIIPIIVAALCFLLAVVIIVYLLIIFPPWGK